MRAHRLALCLVLLSACAAPQAERPGPEEVARRYFAAVAAEDHEQAWALMSTADRQAVSPQELAQRTAQAGPAARVKPVLGEVKAVARVQVTSADPAALVQALVEAGAASDDADPEQIAALIQRKLAAGDIPLVTRDMLYTLVLEPEGWRVISGLAVMSALASGELADCAEAELEQQARCTALQQMHGDLPRVADREAAGAMTSEILGALGLDELEEYDPPPAGDGDAPPRRPWHRDREAAPAAGPAIPDGPPPPELLDAIATGFRAVGEGRYEVDRAALDVVLANLGHTAAQARVVPSFVNGRPDGFKLFSIRPGSLWASMGLQNGDVVHTVNGVELTSPDRALAAYENLRGQDVVTLELSRRGERLTLTYTVVGGTPAPQP